MARLTDEQLLILDNIIYLREIASEMHRFDTIGDFIQYITLEDNLTIDEHKIRIAEKNAKMHTLEAAGKYEEANYIRTINDEIFEVGGLKNGSFQNAIHLVKSQGNSLSELRIIYSSGDYKTDLIQQGENEYCIDGLTAICFQDKEKNAYVIYRGTDGYTAWMENVEAVCVSETDYQRKALSFFESIPDLENFNDIQLSGHSKGGNMVQYITIVSDYANLISHAVTYDGQGFSLEFFQKYENRISQNAGKIVSYSADYDIVNALLYQLEIERHYIKSAVLSKNPFDYHYPDVIFTRNYQLSYETVETEFRKKINTTVQFLIESLHALYPEQVVQQDIKEIGRLLADIMVAENRNYQIRQSTMKHLIATGVFMTIIQKLDAVLTFWITRNEFRCREDMHKSLLCCFFDEDTACSVNKNIPEINELTMRLNLWNCFSVNIDANNKNIIQKINTVCMALMDDLFLLMGEEILKLGVKKFKFWENAGTWIYDWFHKHDYDDIIGQQ